LVTKFFKQSCLIATLFSSFASQAAYWSPHIGVDYKYWGATPRADSSASGVRDFPRLFPKINHAGNIYVGTRVNGNFGFDIGYEQSEEAGRSVTFDGQLAIFGDPETVGDSANVKTNLKAGHLDALLYWEVYKDFELTFMLGLAYLKPDAEILYYSNTSPLFSLDKVKSQWVGRFGFGAQYNPIPCIGLRALVHFDGTQRIEYIGNDEDGAPYDIKPYKSATSFYVGAVYSFSRPRR
jgi:opacity protein-like surface antigen